MKAAFAYYGLVKRRLPVMIVLLFLVLFDFVPMIELPGGWISLVHAWRVRLSSPDVMIALWRETLLIPICIGGAIGMMTIELESALFAWALPSLRRRLEVSAVTVGSVLVCLAATGHWPFSGIAGAFAASGAASAAFAIGVTSSKRSQMGPVWWALAIALGLSVVYPLTLTQTIAPSPAAFALGTLGCAIFLLRRTASVGVARVRHLLDEERGSTVVRNHLLDFDSDLTLTPRQPGDGIFAWWQTTSCAWTGAGRMGWLRAASFSAVSGAVIAYTMNALWLIGLMGTMSFALAPMVGARGRLLYPISRRQRATVLFVGSTIQTGLFLLVSGTVAFLLFRFHPWPQWLTFHADVVPYEEIGPACALAIAWFPLAQWWQFQPAQREMNDVRIAGEIPVRWLVPYLLWYFTFQISLAPYDRTLGAEPPFAGMVILSLLILAVRGAFYLGLRRAYAVKDLI